MQSRSLQASVVVSLLTLVACAADSSSPWLATGSNDPAPAAAASSQPKGQAPEGLPTPVSPDAGTSASPAAGQVTVDTAPATKKTLTIDWERQENGYFCGPASTRIVMTTRDANPPSQNDLGAALGTDSGGTDNIGLVVNVLNAHWSLTGDAAYKVRPISDPPTDAQRATLKSDILARINAGYGIVANIVSGWRPPFYPSGNIYHYIAVVGYDAGGDKVLIADPAGEASSGPWSNVPSTYWIDTSDLAVWIAEKGYSG